MGSLKPAGYLLGRPIQSDLPRHSLPQPLIARQLTAFRTTGSYPGILVSQRRSVSIISTLSVYPCGCGNQSWTIGAACSPDLGGWIPGASLTSWTGRRARVFPAVAFE